MAASSDSSSSLAPEAAEAKAIIESHIGNPDGPYWRGDAARGVTAAELQQEYRDLVRAELAGEAHSVGPPDDIDLDLPMSAAHYDISGAAGARSVTAGDREIVDAFLPAAHAAGLGQRKVQEAIGFCLTHAPSEGAVDEFMKFAMERGWSDASINFCLEWAAAYEPGARALPAATPATRVALADERAEIEKMMGDPGSEYWRGAKAATLQQRYRELLAGG